MIGEHVRWTGAKPDSWAAPGLGKVIDLQTKRVFFGPNRREVGPAVCVKLDHNGLSVWCGIDEVEPAPEAA